VCIIIIIIIIIIIMRSRHSLWIELGKWEC